MLERARDGGLSQMKMISDGFRLMDGTLSFVNHPHSWAHEAGRFGKSAKA
jgi:hypothetical protein